MSEIEKRQNSSKRRIVLHVIDEPDLHTVEALGHVQQSDGQSRHFLFRALYGTNTQALKFIAPDAAHRQTHTLDFLAADTQCSVGEACYFIIVHTEACQFFEFKPYAYARQVNTFKVTAVHAEPCQVDTGDVTAIYSAACQVDAPGFFISSANKGKRNTMHFEIRIFFRFPESEVETIHLFNVIIHKVEADAVCPCRVAEGEAPAPDGKGY